MTEVQAPNFFKSHDSRDILKNSYDVADDVTSRSSPISNQIQVFDEESLENEENRLRTFIGWPNSLVKPEDLAEAGFFYLGEYDRVECVFCGVHVHNWEENDIPMDEHKKWNRNCPFVRNGGTTNNSDSNSSSEHDQAPITGRRRRRTSSSGEDICGNLGVEVLPNSEPEDAQTTTSTTSNLERLGVQRTRGPSHPDKIIYEHRFASFFNWPKSLKQKPRELAEAGFFYLGTGDQTLCFSCGGGLKDWEEDDDPWEQHALWFPKCSYLLLKKTQAFVELVHNKKKDKALKESVKSEAAAEAAEEEEKKQQAGSSDEDEEQRPSCSNSSSNLTKEDKTSRSDLQSSSTSSSGGLSKAGKQKENRGNDENSSTLCKICYKNELGVVFLPCGHMVACIDCASALKECAVCRKPLQATVRAFLS